MGQNTCAVDGCERAPWARGWCGAHYARWSQNGEPGPAEIRRRSRRHEAKMAELKCSVDGCVRDCHSRDLCASHYARWRKHGDPGGAKLKTWYDSAVRDDQGRKRCPSCARWQPLGEFAESRSTRDGLHKRCIRCERSAKLRRQFGLTLDDYGAMLAEQNGACAICLREPEPGAWLCVDHDHACCPQKGKSCGKCVRGLTCANCNTAMGMMRDDPEVLRAAANYLERACLKR